MFCRFGLILFPSLAWHHLPWILNEYEQCENGSDSIQWKTGKIAPMIWIWMKGGSKFTRIKRATIISVKRPFPSFSAMSCNSKAVWLERIINTCWIMLSCLTSDAVSQTTPHALPGRYLGETQQMLEIDAHFISSHDFYCPMSNASRNDMHWSNVAKDQGMNRVCSSGRTRLIFGLVKVGLRDSPHELRALSRSKVSGHPGQEVPKASKHIETYRNAEKTQPFRAVRKRIGLTDHETMIME